MSARAATWLIDVLTRICPSTEPLCGDILEEYRSGRSRVWLWRQLACAWWVGAPGITRALSYQSVEGFVMRCAVLSILAFEGYTTIRLGAFVIGLLRNPPVPLP
jgi:hypothetical protein